MLSSRSELKKAVYILFDEQVENPIIYLKRKNKIDVKKAFRKKAFITHPDRNKNFIRSTDSFIQVRSAYEFLIKAFDELNQSSTKEKVHVYEYKPRVFTDDKIDVHEYFKSFRKAQPFERYNISKKQFISDLPKRNLKFGDFLCYSGVIAREAVVNALYWQNQGGIYFKKRPIGQYFVEKSFLSENKLHEYLQKFHAHNASFAA